VISLAYNHTAKPLKVAVSADGRAWQAALVLAEERGSESGASARGLRDSGAAHPGAGLRGEIGIRHGSG
jgi:hypothetical protein